MEKKSMVDSPWTMVKEIGEITKNKIGEIAKKQSVKSQKTKSVKSQTNR